jgi:hypothetical protein
MRIAILTPNGVSKTGKPRLPGAKKKRSSAGVSPGFTVRRIWGMDILRYLPIRLPSGPRTAAVL